ncbi:60S ribosomal protein L14 [Hyalella azteca]|uniref:Large ribosomal subunit protein eL14 n=1 Tax=Hyalella azteca TaxID=294128 RepID=A0A8B7NF07_HYAAZ|nr:60S ribosomal protein L14 [Hyalella azteca]
MSLFTKYVELGRVVDITRGKCKGHQGVIVNIIDCNRLLVDGPGMVRQEIKLKDARLTKFKLKIKLEMPAKTLKKLWEKAHIDFRFKRLPYVKRAAKFERRSKITDYNAFKVAEASRRCSNIVYSSFRNLRNKYPRMLQKLKARRDLDTAVALGYVKRKTLTPEQKKEREAAKNARHKNAIVKRRELKKKLLERKNKRKEVRKARLAKRAAAGTLKKREFVPKEKRKISKSKPKPDPKPSRERLRRQRRDATLKARAEHRKKAEQKRQDRAKAKKEKKAAA